MSDVALYLIPIEVAAATGNDILGLQVKDTIRNTRLFFVENVRTARRFISSLKLGVDIASLEFHVLDKHSPDQDITKYLSLLKRQSAGIMSEAGSPGIADPGAKLVALAHRQGIKVHPLVGPSAFVLALMGSGMNGQKFNFHGYLPVEKILRRKEIKALEKESQHTGAAQIFMETPYRNNQLLEDLQSTLAANTRLCVACDLTAPDQEIYTLPIRQWHQKRLNLHKRPTVFIIQG